MCTKNRHDLNFSLSLISTFLQVYIYRVLTEILSIESIQRICGEVEATSSATFSKRDTIRSIKYFMDIKLKKSIKGRDSCREYLKETLMDLILFWS